MSTKVRVATIPSDNNEWDGSVFEKESFSKNKKRANFNEGKRRRTEHFYEERRLKQHISHDYSFDNIGI
ncbi:PA3496 family putative envelope integrity protein [Neptunomonas japonica]|uniref:PA3496 family putative envelope integrity protein n=1 Tax=Neptunomonas japonica TaxID=417574 RepID=UPI0019153A65|nr:hypothetical protein [Neptunomonas japonica]